MLLRDINILLVWPGSQIILPGAVRSAQFLNGRGSHSLDCTAAGSLSHHAPLAVTILRATMKVYFETQLMEIQLLQWATKVVGTDHCIEW